MNIGIDARSLSEITSGPSRVTHLLIKEFLKYDKVNKYIIFLNGPYLKNFSLNQLNVIVKYKRNNFVHDYMFTRHITSFELDIFFSTHNWLPLFNIPKVKIITIINDLFHITDRNHFDKYGLFKGLVTWYFKFYTFITVKNSNLIITISNYSKNKILKKYGQLIKKIKVCYLASALELEKYKKTNILTKIDLLPSKYFLYVGNCRSYKNIEILIKGYNHWCIKYNNFNYKLAIVGNDECRRIKKLSSNLGLGGNVIFQKNINDNELIDLYKHAKMFIFPSKQEGFGIPVLESSINRTPVIISDAEALVEVADGTAAVFKRNSYIGLSDCIDKLLNNKDYYYKLINEGYNNTKKYSWSLTAKNILSEFDKITN